ncbi:MAG: hypothetical protein QOH96_3107 [Blastocatellia bacterium]|nr:hypothetical protein [Blastocatellia bacterium]
MAISDNVQKKANAIRQEQIDFPDGPTPISDEVQQKAIKAITGGVSDWVAYMKLFKTSDAELARLIPTDETSDGPRVQARAYLVANGTCGMGTTQHLAEIVTVSLD